MSLLWLKGHDPFVSSKHNNIHVFNNITKFECRKYSFILLSLFLVFILRICIPCLPQHARSKWLTKLKVIAICSSSIVGMGYSELWKATAASVLTWKLPRIKKWVVKGLHSPEHRILLSEYWKCSSRGKVKAVAFTYVGKSERAAAARIDSANLKCLWNGTRS